MSHEVKIILQTLAEHGRQGIEQMLSAMPYDTLILHIKDMTAQGWVDSIITDMADGSELLEYCDITKEGRAYPESLNATYYAKILAWIKNNLKWIIDSILVPLILWIMD